MSIEEISTVNHVLGGEPQTFSVNASDYWNKFQQKGQQERYDEMREDFFWKVMSPHLAPTMELGKKFVEAFLGAKKTREDSLLGAKNKKRVTEEFLYQMAAGVYLQNHPITAFGGQDEQFAISDHEGRRWGRSEFADEMSKLVAEGKHEKLQKLTDIVKSRGALNSFESYQKYKGEQRSDSLIRPRWGESLIVEKWRDFCDYIIEYRQLPNISQLNNRWGDEKKPAQWREQLGLTALPPK